MKVGDIVVCINNKPLKGRSIAPYLIVGNEYEIIQILLDSAGNPHFDVGIVSKYNFITSFETSEELKDGNKIHWCHPSRFELV